MKQLKNLKTVFGVLGLCAIAVLTQSAFAAGSVKKAPPAKKKEMTVEILPDFIPASVPKPVDAPVAQRFTNKKYDPALLENAVFPIIKYARPEEPTRITGLKRLTDEDEFNLIENNQLDRIVYQCDMRAIYDNDDALAMNLGLIPDDGTIEPTPCKQGRYNSEGKLVPCGNFLSIWYIKAGTNTPVLVTGDDADDVGYTYREFKQALGLGAKDIDTWYKQKWGVSRVSARWLVGGVLGTGAMFLWRWQYLARSERVAALAKLKMGAENLTEVEKAAKEFAWWNKVGGFFHGIANTFFVGHEKTKVLSEGSWWFRKINKVKKIKFLDKSMWMIGAGMYVSSFVAEHGFLGVDLLPGAGETFLKVLQDGEADRDIKEMGYATVELANAKCKLGLFLPKDSAFTCGNDVAQENIQKYNLGGAALNSSQEEVPKVELEEDEGGYRAVEEYQKEIDAVNKSVAEKAHAEQWAAQQKVELNKFIPNKLLPEMSEKGIDFELAAAKRFLSALKRVRVHSQPKFYGTSTTPILK